MLLVKVSHSKCVKPEPKTENSNDHYLLGLKIFRFLMIWFCLDSVSLNLIVKWFLMLLRFVATVITVCLWLSVAHHTCIRNILSCQSFQETDLIIISWIWGSLIICERIAMHSWIDFSNPYASDELSNAFKSWKTASLWHGLHGSRGRKLTTHHKQHCVDKTGWDSCHGYTCNLHHIIMHIYHLWGSF